MTAPEPYKDPPPLRPPRVYPDDPLTLERDKRHEITEFGFGAGLVAPCHNGRPPSEGGIYMPRAARVELIGQSLTPRQKRRKRGEAHGWPGEQVAR